MKSAPSNLSTPGSGLMSVLRQVQNKNNMADLLLQRTLVAMRRELEMNMDRVESERLDWFDFLKQLKECHSDDLTEFAPLLLSKLEEMADRPKKRTRFRDVFSTSDLGVGTDEAILLDLPRASIADKMASLGRAASIPATRPAHQAPPDTDRAATLPIIRQPLDDDDDVFQAEGEGRRPTKSRGEMRLAPIVASRPSTQQQNKKSGIITQGEWSPQTPGEGSTDKQPHEKPAENGKSIVQREAGEDVPDGSLPPIAGRLAEMAAAKQMDGKEKEFLSCSFPPLAQSSKKGLVVGTVGPLGGTAGTGDLAQLDTRTKLVSDDCGDQIAGVDLAQTWPRKKNKRARKVRETKPLDSRIQEFFGRLEEELLISAEVTTVPVLPPIEAAANT